MASSGQVCLLLQLRALDCAAMGPEDLPGLVQGQVQVVRGVEEPGY